jgi:hypothetical protein
MKEKTLSILDSNFKYTPSSKTDITRTFARIKKELKNSDSNQDSKEPIVAPILNPNGFVLSSEWFEME